MLTLFMWNLRAPDWELQEHSTANYSRAQGQDMLQTTGERESGLSGLPLVASLLLVAMPLLLVATARASRSKPTTQRQASCSY